jgi:uncharacterized DUF497 family protein
VFADDRRHGGKGTTWDPDKADSNLQKHHVSFLEAATVFGDPLGGIIDDPDHSTTEARFVIMGVFEKFRLLVVVFTEENDTIRIISARQAIKSERHHYEEGQES